MRDSAAHGHPRSGRAAAIGAQVRDLATSWLAAAGRLSRDGALPCSRPNPASRDRRAASGDQQRHARPNMMKPRFSAPPDLERYAPDLLQIDALYAAAGRPAPGAVSHPLVYYASSKTVIELLDVILQVSQAPREPCSDDDRARLRNALEAFEQTADALQRYDVDRIFQPRPSSEGRNALRRVADRPTRKSLESLLARADLRPKYLTALWRAAWAVARDRGGGGGPYPGNLASGRGRNGRLALEARR